jgi:coenzyme A diphosphatase NUDT7
MRGKELFDKLSIALTNKGDQQHSDSGYFSAAVLVPLVLEHDELNVLFEKRSTHLAWQPGEICFPGGRIEKGDKTPTAAAVRETTEELGVKIEQIQVLGTLHEVISPIGVRLYPCVGLISNLDSSKANPGEVAELFTVPLKFLLETEPIIGYMERCTRPLSDFPLELLPGYSKDWQSRKDYQVLFYKYNQYVIWGLTAQVLDNFLEIYKKQM